MTNLEIINFVEQINALKQSKEIAFPTKVAFTITRNLRKLLPIVEDCEQAKRDLIIRYGEKVDDKEGTYQVSSENIDIVNEELEHLLNMDVEDVTLNKIKLDDLNNISLTLEQMEALYPMIDEE